MYRLDWVEQLKLRTAALPSAGRTTRVSPVVWKLGVTSLLTDISAEMVNSVLPVYLILYLHLSPLQYGAIDGIYNGLAVVLLGLAGGLIADRTRRHKEVAAAGYAVSTICKLLFLVSGAAWGWIAAIVAADRTGKGARTAPRDALISFNSSEQERATAFAVHRTLDATGSLLGPLVAFAILSRLPGAFGGVWVVSFAFGILGVAVLWLFVENPSSGGESKRPSIPIWETAGLFRRKRFLALVVAGTALSVATISDGFFYLLLDERGGISSRQYFPLLYVITACWYMLLSIPMGVMADRHGRASIVLTGYGLLCCLYVVLLIQARISLPGCMVVLFFFGLYYAATEGVLMAMVSSIVPEHLRASGLALLVTFINLGKLASSLLFGWLWSAYGTIVPVMVFTAALAAAIAVSGMCIKAGYDESGA